MNKVPQSKEPIPSGDGFVNARKLLGLSQKELAKHLNASLYAVARWERGDVAPSPDILLRLNALLISKGAVANDDHHIQSRLINFASNGSNAHRSSLPSLFPEPTLDLLDTPKDSVLDDIFTNPFWGDGESALIDILNRRCKPAETSTTPINEVVSAGKNTYTYDAHTYHTKVPPQGIANMMAKYLPEGGTVLDPFAGSGMTGVAARYLGYDAILNELSPAASFIAHNFIQKVDIREYSRAIHQLLEQLSNLRKSLYYTTCRECGLSAEILFTVWSYRLECDRCGKIFVLWDHCRKYGRNVREHKLLRRFPCPHCREFVNKSFLKRHDQEPVLLAYRCCSSKIVEHSLQQKDKDTINRARNDVSEYLSHVPTNIIPNGINLNQPKRHGIDTINKFYTPRNLIACGAIWKEIRRIKDSTLRTSLAFTFTSLYQRVTRLAEYRFWGGSGNTANFNVPHISYESNVFVTFRRKAASIADHFATTAKNYNGRSVIRTGSATNLSFLPDCSIDFIFTDPPFGANINYSEMNILWESWLGAFTDPTLEAIVNKTQDKSIQDYQNLMEMSLKEAFRVLRYGHWMLLVFMNSSDKVWNALRAAIGAAGFSIEEISIFDKQHGTFKQFVSDNTAGSDLIIHCRKRGSAISNKQNNPNFSYDISEFVSSQNGCIPKVPFLHVDRVEEIDYRTLYSRYVASVIRHQSTIAGFADFRQEAAKVLSKVRADR